MKKRNHLKKIALVALVLATGFVACKDDDDNNGPVYTQKEIMLTADTWAFANATVSDSVTQDSIIYQPCAADDSLNFTLDFKFTFSDGATACDSSIAPYGDGIWAFNGAQDTLKVKEGNTLLKWEVKKLNDTLLQVQYVDSIDGNAWTKTLSFARAAPADSVSN